MALIVAVAVALVGGTSAHGVPSDVMNKIAQLESKLATLEAKNHALEATKTQAGVEKAASQMRFQSAKSEPVPAPTGGGTGSVTGAGGADGGPVDWPPRRPNTIDGQLVPFGKHIPRKPGVTYFVANGMQECMLCQVSPAPATTMSVAVTQPTST